MAALRAPGHEGRSLSGGIVARVAELINGNPEYAPDSDTEVDPRIAIPLAGLALKRRLLDRDTSFDQGLRNNPLIPKEGETHLIALARSPWAPTGDDAESACVAAVLGNPLGTARTAR